jgi:hypothetical protein
LLVEVGLDSGAAGALSGSGSFGPHWDLMRQMPVERKSPLTNEND